MSNQTEPEQVLAGRVAVVTGGSRGLGREMVRAFAARGASVVIVSRKLDACEALAEEVRADFGATALPISCHMGDWAAQDALVDRIYAELGRVDVLVNNAGMSPTYPSLAEVSEELFDKVIGVNLKGPFRLTALVGGRMAAGDAAGGSIINISSIASERPTVNDLPYAAAKAGLNILTKGYAQAYGPKVRVNAIMAGPFLTDVSTHWPMEIVAEKSRAYPLQRFGNPEEIVGAALYLASDASSYTTGAIIAVDGGRSSMTT